MLFSRMEAFFEGKAQAATLFGGPYSQLFEWIAEHAIFEWGKLGDGG
jgi:hypothetical protein